jgi:hypothetical protein
MTLRSTKFYTGSDSSARSSIASADGSWEGATGSEGGAEGPERLDALGEGVAAGLRRASELFSFDDWTKNKHLSREVRNRGREESIRL